MDEKIIHGFANDKSTEDKLDTELEDRFVTRQEFDELINSSSRYITELRKAIKFFGVLISVEMWVIASVASCVFSVFTDPYSGLTFGGIFGFLSWLAVKEFI